MSNKKRYLIQVIIQGVATNDVAYLNSIRSRLFGQIEITAVESSKLALVFYTQEQAHNMYMWLSPQLPKTITLLINEDDS